MTETIDFPIAKPKIDDLMASMRRHWRSGKRSPKFHHAVQADCPTATLAEFNAAADVVWHELSPDPFPDPFDGGSDEMTVQDNDAVQPPHREKHYDSYFGGCPKCGGTHGCINVGRDHWSFCDDHKMKWCIGSNLFSSWRDEDDAVWERSAQFLSDYNEADPIGGGSVA